MSDWLLRQWYSPPTYVTRILAPLSYLFRFLTACRRWLYRFGIKQVTRFPKPVIVVGNLTVGGTGKTPLVIWLAQWLQQQGYRVGIVSRGYGGKAKAYPIVVSTTTDATLVGEEPLLIAQRTHCPVVVAPKRVQAVSALLVQYPCDVVISDDGLQHYALARDIEVIVVDGMRRFGNGYCLPAGPLREAHTRLQQADLVLINGHANENELSMQLVPDNAINLVDSQRILSFKEIKKPLHAVAAIGNPERFFMTLRQLGLEIIPHVFPDHYFFQAKDFAFLQPHEEVIMTEKDAIKCRAFADERFWCLPVTAVPDNNFIRRLMELIPNVLI